MVLPLFKGSHNGKAGLGVIVGTNGGLPEEALGGDGEFPMMGTLGAGVAPIPTTAFAWFPTRPPSRCCWTTTPAEIEPATTADPTATPTTACTAAALAAATADDPDDAIRDDAVAVAAAVAAAAPPPPASSHATIAAATAQAAVF